MWAPLHNISQWIIGSVFVGAFLASPHCVAMCGPVVSCFAQRKRGLLLYQVGRLSGYLIAGSLAGGFGQWLASIFRISWLSLFSVSLMGVGVLWMSYRMWNLQPLHVKGSVARGWSGRITGSIFALVRGHRNLTAVFAGLMTIFLPCGHLYGFLLGASATGSALAGAGFMFAFWAGSAPLPSFGSVWFQRWILDRRGLRRHIGIGILLLAGCWSVLRFARSGELQFDRDKASPTIQNAGPICR